MRFISLAECIAIALEQLVEAWHWQSEVVEARKAIIAEILKPPPELDVLGPPAGTSTVLPKTAMGAFAEVGS